MSAPTSIIDIPALELRQVGVEYRDKAGYAMPTLSEMSFTVPEGNFASVIGPSGCGKTTLLRLLCGLQFPTSGDVWCRGREVAALNTDVGYISQDSNLFPWMTVRQNIEYPLLLRHMPTAARKEASTKYIELARLEGFEQHYPWQLSGGMQKRVSLVRTLIYDPDIVLMDEPFVALDAQTRIELQDDLQRMFANRRQTVLLVTHDIMEAVALSDQIVVLGPRPARVQDVIQVPITRPRNIRDLPTEPRFAELYDRAYRTMQEPTGNYPGTALAMPGTRDGGLDSALAGGLDGALAGVRPQSAVPDHQPGSPRRGSNAAHQLGNALTGRTAQLAIVRILILLLILGAWQAAAATGAIDRSIFSDPLTIARRVGYLLGGGQAQNVSIYPQIATTLKEWLYGYAIGGAIAILFGMVLGRIRVLAEVLQPLILLAYGVPVISIAPLFVLFLGIGLPSKVGIGVITAFFAIFFQVYAGARAIPQERIKLARIMSGTRWQIARTIVFPSSLPSIFLGLRIAVPFTMTGVVIGEFIASSQGIGWFITSSAAVSDAPDLFAALVILLAIVWILGQVVQLAEWRTVGRRTKDDLIGSAET